MVSGLRDVLIDKNPFSENTVNFYHHIKLSTIFRFLCSK